MILPRIIFDNFPPYTWAGNEFFSEKDFIRWQQDYEKWKKARTIKAKNKIADRWAIKPKSKYYKKAKTFRGYKKGK